MSNEHDLELRLLTVELLNLKEQYFSDPTPNIINLLHQKAFDSSEISPKATKKKSEKGTVSKSDLAKRTNLLSGPKPKKNKFGDEIDGVWFALLVLAGALWYYVIRVHSFHPVMAYKSLMNETCFMETNLVMMEMGRRVFNCEMCKNITEFPVVNNITREEFIAKYAYSGIPVLVKGAIGNWSALHVFSYEFFRDTYLQFPNGFSYQNENAQFFPYKSGFETLEEALTMGERRAQKPWYFGWSNEHPEVAEILRSHYSRPHFLPLDSESSSIDWMFMGTPKKGAPEHIDAVDRPSWQAQIKGTKQWFLRPSPECMSVCKEIDVVVSPGDILVVDTNQWYHSTVTHDGDISITIGSEYD